MGNGILDKLKVLIGIEELEDDEFDDFDEPREVLSPERHSLEQRGNAVLPRQDMRENREQRDNKREFRELRENKEQRVLPMNAQSMTGQFRMVLTEPKSLDECPKLVDNLKARKPVIINLEKIEAETARKIFDFLSGATYALNGNVEKVANNIFIFAPENVDVMAGLDGKMSYSDNLKSNPWR